MQYVLAVVDDQEQPASPQRVDDAVDQAHAVLRAHSQDLRHREDDVGSLGDGGELAQPHSLRERVAEEPAGLERETRLSHSTGARQGHESRRAVPQQTSDVGQLDAAPDQRRRSGRQVGRECIE